MEDKGNKGMVQIKEFAARSSNGMAVLLLTTLFFLISIGLCVVGGILLSANTVVGTLLLVVGVVYAAIIWPISLAGLKVIKPNEAMVLTLFGKYHGTLQGAGFYFVNPFCSAVVPANSPAAMNITLEQQPAAAGKTNEQPVQLTARKKVISLKTMTLENQRQKINDQMGNPIIIGVVVIWRVTNTVKAVFNVDNYLEFLSIQCDSALRNIVRLYPYDSNNDDGGHEKSLRGSSQEIAGNVQAELQEKVEIAGLEILEVRITHLAYAPEIAAAMLQRQQASAVVDARQLIVEGAVGMVEMALEKLSERSVVELDEERKAAMVSNLLVVLCGSKEAQPIVNSGSLY